MKNIISWSERHKATQKLAKFGCEELSGYFWRRPYIYCFWATKVKKTNIQNISCTTCPFLFLSSIEVGSFLFRSFLTFIASSSPFVIVDEYICKTYICNFVLMKLVLIDSMKGQSLNFAMIASFSWIRFLVI